MKRIPRSLIGICMLVVTLVFGLAGQASADGRGHRVIVTPDHPRGWSTADTRPGGAVTFVTDPTAPAGRGALELTTDATTTAKAQYLHAANTSLASVTDLNYYTKQNSAPFAGGDPAYQLVMFLNGGTSGFSTLVFEPYQNPLEGAVVPNVWQRWDVAAGLFWSTRTVTCSGGTVAGTPGGPSSYTLAQINALCPDAMVIGFGVNIGSNNPGYDVETDLFNFNGTIYDFEPAHTCAKDDGGDRSHDCGKTGHDDDDGDDADGGND